MYNALLNKFSEKLGDAALSLAEIKKNDQLLDLSKKFKEGIVGKMIPVGLGKYIEMKDLYIGLPMLFLFLLLFSFTNHKIASLIFLTICVFLMIPVNVSKKNRMYKVVILFVKYIFNCKEYIYKKNGDDINWKEKLKMKKI